ncbi:MAG: hypothetical protein NC131_06085 [Roseburia sp.]|nr:hypothetical protein [Roseburia sp.]
MFTNIVKNQYVGKSKVDFTFKGSLIDGTTLVKQIGILFADNFGEPFNNQSSFLPDYYIPGKVVDLCTMEIGEIPAGETSFLFITGIPKRRALDNYKLKDVVWSSYYEDAYRGYLFQLINSTKVELLNVKDIKINMLIA